MRALGRGGSLIIVFKAPPSLVDAIDRLARELGVSRSELIRDALKEYLRKRSGGNWEARKLRVKRVVLD